MNPDPDDAAPEAASRRAFKMDVGASHGRGRAQMFFEKVLRGENAGAPRFREETQSARRARLRRELMEAESARGRCGWRRWPPRGRRERARSPPLRP